MPDAETDRAGDRRVTPHRYRIRVLDAAAHLFEVELVVAKPDPAGQAFSIPSWIPGSYMIRDYAKHVVAARASSDGVGVALEKVDKSTWRAAPVSRELTLTLEIYAHDESVRGAHLDTTHAYFNGTCVFAAVAGQEDVACDVEIEAPDLAEAKNWRVATSLQRDGAEPYSFGRYRADDYADLVDHPVEAAEQTIGEFEAGGVPHAIAIRGAHRADMARLCHDLAAICEQHQSLLGLPADLDRYIFLLHAPSKGYGGLEHRFSSSNVCARDNLPVKGDEGVSDNYRTLLGLLSHEYFHLWNVKRMRPAAFTPYELAAESYTALLWVFEGITSYYDDLALLRSGRISVEDYLEEVGKVMTRVRRGAGRRRQSLAESSFDAWTKFYQQDANATNAIVSYYAKGSLLALLLDLKLRLETRGETTLDDVMRAAWDRWHDGGMPEDGLERIAAEVSGLDLDDFFDAAVRGTGELPLDPALREHGIDVNWRAASGRGDKGGKPPGDDAAPDVWLGAALTKRGSKTVFASVDNDGPAERAGISPGDQLVAIDGVRTTTGNCDDRQRRYRPRDRSRVLVFRGDDLIETKLTWQAAPETTCYLELAEDIDGSVEARRRHWLGR